MHQLTDIGTTDFGGTGIVTFSVKLSPLLIGHFEDASLAKLHTGISSGGKLG